MISSKRGSLKNSEIRFFHAKDMEECEVAEEFDYQDWAISYIPQKKFLLLSDSRNKSRRSLSAGNVLQTLNGLGSFNNFGLATKMRPYSSRYGGQRNQ